MDNFEVDMVHDDLAAAPVFHLPQNFSMETYRAGREADWLNIHEQSDQFNAFTPFVFRDQFGDDDSRLSRCQIYLLNSSGEAIGTATAWINERTAYSGRIHWVAILPQWQGQGLAKPLLSQVCQKLLEQGHTKSCLSTSTARVAAISLYLKFGFRPSIKSECDEMNWQNFRKTSGISLPE